LIENLGGTPPSKILEVPLPRGATRHLLMPLPSPGAILRVNLLHGKSLIYMPSYKYGFNRGPA